jgi:hypothetical protein
MGSRKALALIFLTDLSARWQDLPMRAWRALWELIHTWQGIVLAALATLGAVYYGPRKMLETWDWYWDRFRDSKVLLLIQRRKLIPPSGGQSNFGHPPPPVELPYEIQEIADFLGRKKKSVIRSVKRLWRRGKIEPFQNGWRIKS